MHPCSLLMQRFPGLVKAFNLKGESTAFRLGVSLTKATTSQTGELIHPSNNYYLTPSQTGDTVHFRTFHLLILLYFIQSCSLMVDAVLTGAYFNLQPFTNNFPRADIHELLSPDLLHQLIKGTFKDHLVTWVNDYIKAKYSTREANRILDDIDQR